MSDVEWLYKETSFLNEKNISKIQFELYVTFRWLSNKKDENALWISFSAVNVEESCPTLISLLKEVDLYKDFTIIGFSQLSPGRKYPIHNDEHKYSLNIPVQNCEKSYTIFYDKNSLIEVNSRPADGYYSNNHSLNYDNFLTMKNYSFDGAVELGRCEYTVPYWINVEVPHLPYSENEKHRILAVLRFKNQIEKMLDEKNCAWVKN